MSSHSDNNPLQFLIAILTFNEGEKLNQLISEFPSDFPHDILVVDDGSTDETPSILKNLDLKTITHKVNLGVGAGIKAAIEFGRKNNYSAIVIMAGNGKMKPNEINRLLEPIIENKADYVQGSRYLDGGVSQNLPLFRRIAIKLFTIFSNLILGFRGTDITCGFRAYKLDLFDNPAINIHQDWLNQYEMEYYIHYQVIKNNYRVVECPVSMIYPKEGKNYSKIKPFIGWWSMIRPWLFLTLRLKK